jgi:methionine-rich copper-binding protein CopC
MTVLPGSRPRAAGTATALLLLTVILVAITAAGCARDGTSTTASPADGAALAVAPRAVDLTFDRRPDPAQSHVTVVGSPSAPLDAGELTAAGPGTLRQPVKAAGKGTVVVGYHVVFDDGTEESGTVRFSVGTGEGPTTSAAPAHQHGVDPFGAALLVVDLAVLLGVVATLKLRPRRRAEDGPPSG